MIYDTDGYQHQERFLINFVGLPAHISLAGISQITILPAPITALTIKVLIPINTLSLIWTSPI